VISQSRIGIHEFFKKNGERRIEMGEKNRNGEGE
jgi:hypothetical protein